VLGHGLLGLYTELRAIVPDRLAQQVWSGKL